MSSCIKRRAAAGLLSPWGEGRGEGGLPLPASASHLPKTRHSPSFIRISCKAGGGRGRRLPVSPLADQAPSASADAVWLPGGYPELHAGGSLRTPTSSIACAHSRKANPSSECGGYMVLGDGLIDAKGERHAMLGLLRLETSFAARKLHLGYRRAELLVSCVLGERGGRFGPRVSLFLGAGRERRKAAKRDKRGSGACVRARPAPRNVTGSFLHVIDRWSPAALARR